MTSLAAQLTEAFGARARHDVPLAPMTTFKVGGRADWLIDTQSAPEVLQVLRLCHGLDAPVTLLGGGSNVLVGDRGIRGVVVRPRGGVVEPTAPDRLRADAPITINGLVRWTIHRGLAGLEAWAGTPGTIGGAIYGNAHWNRTNISAHVSSVELASLDGTVTTVPASAMEFAYDHSRLKRSGEVLLSATFEVAPGHDPAMLRAVARESLAFRKRTQPLESPSAGCIFMNPDPSRDRVPEGLPPSAGGLVERAGFKGRRNGGARVSSAHANFIINDGRATAAEIRALIEECRAAVQTAFDVTLHEEIVYLGEF